MRAALLLTLLTPLAAHADKFTRADAHAAVTVLATVSTVDDAEMRYRLLLQGCAETSACAAHCEKLLSAAAQADPSDRGALLAACQGFDYRARWDKGDKVKPSLWIEQHWTQLLNALDPIVAKGDREAWSAARKSSKL